MRATSCTCVSPRVVVWSHTSVKAAVSATSGLTFYGGPNAEGNVMDGFTFSDERSNRNR